MPVLSLANETDPSASFLSVTCLSPISGVFIRGTALPQFTSCLNVDIFDFFWFCRSEYLDLDGIGDDRDTELEGLGVLVTADWYAREIALIVGLANNHLALLFEVYL